MQPGVGEPRGGRAAAGGDGYACGGRGSGVRVHHVRLDVGESVAVAAAAVHAGGGGGVGAHGAVHGGGAVLDVDGGGGQRVDGGRGARQHGVVQVTEDVLQGEEQGVYEGPKSHDSQQIHLPGLNGSCTVVLPTSPTKDQNQVSLKLTEPVIVKPCMISGHTGCGKFSQ